MAPAAEVRTSAEVSTVVLAGVASRASPRVAVTVTRSVRAAGTNTTRTSVPGCGVTSTLAKPRAVTVTGSPPPVAIHGPVGRGLGGGAAGGDGGMLNRRAGFDSTTTTRAVCAHSAVDDVSNRTAAVHTCTRVRTRVLICGLGRAWLLARDVETLHHPFPSGGAPGPGRSAWDGARGKVGFDCDGGPARSCRAGRRGAFERGGGFRPARRAAGPMARDRDADAGRPRFHPRLPRAPLRRAVRHDLRLGALQPDHPTYQVAAKSAPPWRGWASR